MFNSENRALIHMIVVFINNFGNHILHLVSEISKNTIFFHFFNLLINETYQKAMDIGPENSQTGPAIRQIKTINKHLEMLSDQNLKNLYLNLTSIQKNES